MSDENWELNIAIKLSSMVEQRVLEMNRELAKLGELVYEFDDGYVPHLTIYSVEYPVEQEARVREEFGKLVEELAVLTVELDRLEVHGAYAEVMVAEGSGLRDLHYRVMERFSPLRLGHVREKYRRPDFLKDYPSGEVGSIEKWGRPIVGEFYRPHISVGRLVEGRIPEEYLSWEPVEMKVNQFLLGRSGAWGVVREMVAVGGLR